MRCEDNDHHWTPAVKRGKILCEFCGVSLDIEMRRMNQVLDYLSQSNVSRAVYEWRTGK